MSAGKTIQFTLNGRSVSAAIGTHWNLVELLHQQGLTGARESCGQGLCGCCTVLVDGVAVSGCLYLAVRVDGEAVTTVESLDEAGALSPVQQAFIDTQAAQCGYCLNGMLMMTVALLKRHPQPTDAQIRQALSGNVCRCGTHLEIMAAVKEAAQRMATLSA